MQQTCPENCDTSCYRCLRSFKNKFEHILLDRHVGAELTGQLSEFDSARLQKSTTWPSNDLRRQGGSEMTYQDGVHIALGRGASVIVPVLATRKDGKQFAIALSGPVIIIVNELLVRGNLPAATREVQQRVWS